MSDPLTDYHAAVRAGDTEAAARAFALLNGAQQLMIRQYELRKLEAERLQISRLERQAAKNQRAINWAAALIDKRKRRHSRMLEVKRLVLEGQSTKEIAAHLGITPARVNMLKNDLMWGFTCVYFSSFADLEKFTEAAGVPRCAGSLEWARENFLKNEWPSRMAARRAEVAHLETAEANESTDDRKRAAWRAAQETMAANLRRQAEGIEGQRIGAAEALKNAINQKQRLEKEVVKALILAGFSRAEVALELVTTIARVGKLMYDIAFFETRAYFDTFEALEHFYNMARFQGRTAYDYLELRRENFSKGSWPEDNGNDEVLREIERERQREQREAERVERERRAAEWRAAQESPERLERLRQAGLMPPSQAQTDFFLSQLSVIARNAALDRFYAARRAGDEAGAAEAAGFLDKNQRIMLGISNDESKE